MADLIQQDIYDDYVILNKRNNPQEVDQLDEKMREMTPQQRKDYVAEKAAERAQIQQQIEVLSARRQNYIKQQIEQKNLKDTDSLDQQLYKCIRIQGNKKGIVYSDGPMY